MYVGFMPGVKPGDVMGHEFMGIVESVGSEVKNLKPGENCEACIEPNYKACMEPIYHCCYVCHWAICTSLAAFDMGPSMPKK